MNYQKQKIKYMYKILYLLTSSFFLFYCKEKDDSSIKLPYYNKQDFTPIFIKDKSKVNQIIKHEIGNFSFLNQDSLIISQKRIEGKIHVANFIFTTCGSICPVMTSHMKIVNDSLKQQKDIIFLSYSVTPWIDSPKVLKNYMSQNNIKSKNWEFLTGSKSEIYKLARQSYFAEEDFGFNKDASEFLHTEHFILVDKSKRIRGIYNGTLILEMYQLIEDIKVLQSEE